MTVLFSRFNKYQDISLHKKRWVTSFTFFLLLVFSGCDGGGGGTTSLPPPAPTVQNTVILSQFRMGVWANFIDWSECAAFEETGAQWTYAEIVWSVVEPNHGDFSYKALDALVNRAEICGIELVLKVRTGQLDWATTHEGSVDVGERPSFPPNNLDEYKQFLNELAKHLKGKVRRYAIENEVNTSSWWAGTAYDFHELLVAAYETIKAADPDAQVVDFGIASGAYAPVITQSIYNASGAQEAISFWNLYASHRIEDMIATETELQKVLSNNQDIIDRVTYHLQNDLLYFDIYQLHFYEEWNLLPTVITWIRDRIGTLKSIEAWEIGYAWEVTNYDESDHAQDIIRLVASALKGDVQRICYLPYKASSTTEEIWMGLYDPSEDPRQALWAYQTLMNKVSSAVELDVLSFSDPDIHGYRFEFPMGSPVYLFWAADSKDIRLLSDKSAVTLTDYLGNLSTGDPSLLSITSLPTFVGE